MGRPLQSSARIPPVVWGVVATVVAVLLVVAPRYGFHRDELYFLAAGRRLDWGYVDQPPLTPLLARLVDTLPGNVTPLALRVLPALCAGGAALVAALLARRFGGRTFAMACASAFVGGMGIVLAASHLFSTTTFDLLLSSLVLLGLARLVDGADQREWLWVGLVVGVAGLNKLTIAGTVLALLAGLLLTSSRGLLRSRWPWLAGGLAMCLVAPTLVWQAGHGWPQLEMSASLRADSDGPVAFLAMQLISLSVFLAIPAAAGFGTLWRARDGRWRLFPWAYLILLVVYLLAAGSFYYVAPLYIPLLAAGAVWLEGRAAAARILVLSLCAVGVGTAAVIALPILPIEDARVVNDVNAELGETAGWPELVDQVRTAVDLLPSADRSRAVIFTSNYGEAGALEVLGADLDLPPVTSGHNSYWTWGPPQASGPIITVGPTGPGLARICPDLEQVSVIDNGVNISNEEQGQPISICWEPRGTLDSIWDELRHYN